MTTPKQAKALRCPKGTFRINNGTVLYEISGSTKRNIYFKRLAWDDLRAKGYVHSPTWLDAVISRRGRGKGKA